ncbi:hypothetical protein M231_03856 [Tremella mesenterica]|uniref:Alpha N-terminal protein methyltransferase 1 n=1 Tax=Tremella mesenterica TaxID=5217 RepID=A0A4V1M427_TREME|nr:hypothetical protein M231_03856 [Tremella mesenterica]
MALSRGDIASSPGPDYDKGVQYWQGVEASVDGVLGGYGNGPVPHIDQLSSRLFLLSILPQLHVFSSPLTPLPRPPPYRLVALDVGAGIGRVSRNVLLPLFDDVVLVEPANNFIREAHRSALSDDWPGLSPCINLSPSTPAHDSTIPEQVPPLNKRLLTGKGVYKQVLFVKNGLQTLEPVAPCMNGQVVGQASSQNGTTFPERMLYDVIWCQWCLGHMSHVDLVAFLKRARAALRPSMAFDPLPTPFTPTHPGASGHPHRFTDSGIIVVKENVCEDDPSGDSREILDEQDSSLTRSVGRWREVFEDAGLVVLKEEVQHGMPTGLFTVKTWALR